MVEKLGPPLFVLMKKMLLALSSSSLMALSTLSSAQEFDMDKLGIESGVSTLGFYVAPDYEISDDFRVRAPIYLGKVSGTFDVEGNDLDGSLNVTSLHLMGDYYLGNSGFRASGGVAIGGYSLDGSMTNPTLDGVTYTGDFTGTLEQDKKVAPVVAFGYQHTFSNNWGFSAELGARITSLKLSTTGQEKLSAADQASFNADLAELNSDLNGIKALPFLSLGVSYRF